MVLTYAVLDFRTSANTAIKAVARGGVHAALFSILFTYGIYYLFTFWKDNTFSPVKSTLWLVTVIVIVSDSVQSAYNWSAAIHIALSLLWLFLYHFFRNYLKSNPQAINQVVGIVGIFFLFYVFSALYATYFINAYMAQKGQDRLAVVNLVYSVIVFLPWIPLVKKRWIRTCAVCIVLLVVLVSMKRGAIIVFPLMLSTWMLVEAKVNKQNLFRPATKIISMMILFIAGLLVADILSNGFLSERFSTKELASGSGRSNMYSYVLKDAAERSFTDLLFGYGSGISHGVHNEWLEFLFTFGFIGVIAYVLLLSALFWEMRQLIKRSSPYSPAYAMAIVYMLVVGMYGGVFFVHSMLFVMTLFGTIQGLMLNNSNRMQALNFDNATL